MNKFTLTLAAGAFALISACSDDKDDPSTPSLTELCKDSNNPAPECLDGTWRLTGTDNDMSCPGTGTLTINKVNASENKGEFRLIGGAYDWTESNGPYGTWTLNGSSISVNNLQGEVLTGTVKVTLDSDNIKMEVTSNTKYSVFSYCDSKSTSVTEYFERSL